MSQKMENILNLALNATEEERVRSGELDVGYDPETKEWELIVKYSGSLERAEEIAEAVAELSGGYAVLVIKEERIDDLASLSEVEFIEKPKSLYFQADVGRQTSCIDSVREEPFELTGRGVLIGVVDSGIDYENPDFRNADGTTRIAALWDQSIPGAPPEGYFLGTEYTEEQINNALAQSDRAARLRLIPSRDESGHGTAVAGIAAGNGRGSAGERYQGAAPEAGLIVVKMGIPRTDGFSRTTELMQGVDYVIKKALELQMPVAVNISFGNTYGSHEPYN